MRDTPIHGNKTVLVSAQQPRGLVLYSISVGNGKLVQESSDPNFCKCQLEPCAGKAHTHTHTSWNCFEVCEFSMVSADSELHAVQTHQNLRCRFHPCPWLRCAGTGGLESPLVSLLKWRPITWRIGESPNLSRAFIGGQMYCEATARPSRSHRKAYICSFL